MIALSPPVVSIPLRYAKNSVLLAVQDFIFGFQFLLGTLKTLYLRQPDADAGIVSIPLRYAKNPFSALQNPS